MPNDYLLDVRDLTIKFEVYGEGLRRKENTILSKLNVHLDSGEVLAIVGASGSGKTMLAHAVIGILPDGAMVSGQIWYKGELMTKRQRKQLRGSEIVFVPQSVSSLDPRMKIGKQVRGLRGTRAKQEEVFARYELSPSVADLYPFQLSGGMARRVLMSTAVMNDAKLIVLDEPTPGMSKEQGQEALKDLRGMADNGSGIILITHDLELALTPADRIAVFYDGTILEMARSDDFEGTGERLRHPYTRALWRSLPRNDFVPARLADFYPKSSSPNSGFKNLCAFECEECVGDVELREWRGGEVRCCHAM